MNLTKKELARNLVMIVVGSAVFSLGFDLFLDPNGISCGGVSGIAMLIVYGTKIPWLTVGILSAAINIRPNVASLSIRTLTDRNLITRVPNPKDRRAANVTLSRKGARFVHATKGELIDIFDSCYPALAERETLEFFPV